MTNESIIKYTEDQREFLERFRMKTFQEGNDSLDYQKFDPDSFNGSIWCAYLNGEIVSMSAAEISHYTNEIDVIRKCRYHILKQHRHGRYGFKFLRKMMHWGKEQGFKLLYWTHDIHNKPLNALYQRQRSYAFNNDNMWFYQWPYNRLQFETDKLFKTGKVYQFVYSIKIDEAFEWLPTSSEYMLYFDHCGDTDKIKKYFKVT